MKQSVFSPLKDQVNLIARTFFLAATLMGSVLPGLTLAAGGGNVDPWTEILYKAINFFILVSVILFFARKPVMRALRGSAEEAKNSYTGTRELAEKTASDLAAQKDKITRMNEELNRMIADARKDAEEERKQLVANAESQAQRIKNTATMQIEQEMVKARAEIRAQLADEAVRLAEEIIRGKMDDQQRTRMVQEFITQLEAGR